MEKREKRKLANVVYDATMMFITLLVMFIAAVALAWCAYLLAKLHLALGIAFIIFVSWLALFCWAVDNR